jgi:hypothetical protein
MELATLISTYREALELKYADALLPSHRRALDAITRCRTAQSGEVLARCNDCGQLAW